MKIFAFLFLGLSVVSASEVGLQEFVKGNNLFTADIYKEIRKNKKENFLVSPFSAEIALAFAQSGCEGETAEEIQNTLHLPNSKDKIKNAVKTLLSTMIGNDLYTLHTANKMYLKENSQIKESFKKAATEVYNAEIENIDFTKKKEAAEKMNDWVEKQTENKIHNLIDPNNLDEDTRAVLINALYFKAKWSVPFYLVYTQKEKFYKSSNDIIDVDMMHRYREFYNYYECPHLNAKLLELPFIGAETVMTIILPNEKEGITSLESKMDMVFAPHNFTEEFVIKVAIPKFKIETKIDLKEILGNLGVNKAFDEEKADLSGIAGKKGDLYINSVVQKTFLELNDEGVEAAAATDLGIAVPKSDVTSSTPPKEFIVDHPFIFHIKVKNIIIFAGKVIAPHH